MDVFILVGLLGPLVAGCLGLFVSNRHGGNAFVQILFIFSAIIGGIGALLFLLIDGWSAFFLILIHVGTLMASVYAIGYLPRYRTVYSLPVLNFVSGLFLFGMQATVLASSVFVFLLSWEIMSVAAYFLVIADHEPASIKAGFWYFVMTHLGVSCLLAAFLLLAGGDVTASFATLADHASTLPIQTLGLAFFLFFAGFGSKAGLVPLHLWLPHAHPQAPSHSSALMSGVMLKVALYGFLRVAFFVFPTIPWSWAIVVIAFGFLSALFGVLYASVETDLKRLLAWSSIENMGLIFSAVGFALLFRALGLPSEAFVIAALFHAANHTLFKTGLFLSAGSIISETHTRDLDALGGLAKPWPVFSFFFLGLVFAASALPPFGTFYAELISFQQLATGMMGNNHLMTFLLGLAISFIALIGGLAIFTFAKTFATIFLSKPRSSHAEQVKPLPFTFVGPIGACALLSLALGVFAAPVTEAMSGLSGSLSFAVPPEVRPAQIFLVMIVVGVLIWMLRRAFTRQDVRLTDTWDCGQPLTARMEYTATGFAAPIRFFFRSLLLAHKTMQTERVSVNNPWILKRHLIGGTRSLWEVWVYRSLSAVILWIATRVRRLQNGIIQFYLLLIVVTLVATLLIAV